MLYLEEENQKRKRFIFFFILISLLLHGFLGVFLYLLPKFVKGPEIAKPENEVVWVTPEILAPAEIADIEKPKVEQRPQKARFAGQYDSAVKEEAVARPKPKPKVLKENPDSSEEPEKSAKASKPSPVAQAQKPAKRPPAMKKPAAPEPEAKPKEEAPSEEKPIAKKEPLPEKSPVKPDNFLPKTETDLNLRAEDVYKTKPSKKEAAATPSPPRDLSLKSAGSGLSLGRASSPDLFAHDYYPDYKIGGKTYLNVMKLQDVGYFVRMKRILKMRWNPVPAVERYLMSNRLSMGKIECVLGLALDPSGNIAELFVIRSSGVGGYDQEAIQTIRDSSPFSSPPDQYLKDGQLRMSWTFTVYL